MKEDRPEMCTWLEVMAPRGLIDHNSFLGIRNEWTLCNVERDRLASGIAIVI